MKKQVLGNCMLTLETPEFKKLYWVEQTTDENDERHFEFKSSIQVKGIEITSETPENQKKN